jgi:hypothetical protein
MPMMNRNDEEASICLVGSQTRGKIWKTTHPRNMDTRLPTAKPPIAKMTIKSNHEKATTTRQHDNDSTGSQGWLPKRGRFIHVMDFRQKKHVSNGA